MHPLISFEALISLLTLTLLEVVLGVDNLVFIAITSSRLPKAQQKRARRFGLMLAWISRLLLLASAFWLAKLTRPFFYFNDFGVSIRDIFLFCGGLFLVAKATQEIHAELEPSAEEENTQQKPRAKFSSVVAQIAILDIVFSLDSVITAIGLTHHFIIMAIAITIAIAAMILASEPLCKFVETHPTVKMLALSFLILIGMVLIADGVHFHIPRGYIYFSLSFAILVEVLNWLRQKRRRKRKKG